MDAATLHCDDWDQFVEARRQFLAELGDWARDAGLVAERDQIVDDVQLILEWKFNYGDRRLERWTSSDVEEFLLGWCPAKLSVPAGHASTLPGSVLALGVFLHEAELLAAGSMALPQLAELVGRLVEPFHQAMDDPGNFGLAKSMMAAALEAGADPNDPESMERFMEQFNQLPFDERSRLLPDSAFGPGPEPGVAGGTSGLGAPGGPATAGQPAAPRLPPMVMPDESALAASRAEAPILARLAGFARYVGDGRKLTAKGNLTLADARALVAELHTGDRIDEVVGGQTFKTTSSAHLRGLRQIFAWARKAGLVLVANGKVTATKRGQAMAADPSAQLDRVLDALMELGPLQSQNDPEAPLAWPEVDAFIDGLSLMLLTGPYVRREPMALAELAVVAVDQVRAAFRFSPQADTLVEERIAWEVIDLTDTFVLAGVVRRLEVPEREPSDSTSPPARHRAGGLVELTPVGWVFVNRLLVAAGYDAPVAGGLAGASATELLLQTDDDDFDSFQAEAAVWLDRRTPAEAVADLAVAAREIDDLALGSVALALMAQVDVALAAAEVRELADDPRLRGFARCWLVDFGGDDESSLYDPDDPSWFVDVLAQRWLTEGPDGLVSALSLAGPDAALASVIARMWRSPSSATESVLGALGEVHPVKPVAKAARKAVLQRRSWLATGG